MTRSELATDAHRALNELRARLCLSGEWTVDLRVEEVAEDTATCPAELSSGCVEIDLPYLRVTITLSPTHIRAGETLWRVLAHECLHLYQAELTQSIGRIRTYRSGGPVLAAELQQALEVANVRVERLFLRLCPCPRWLKSRIYDPAP